MDTQQETKQPEFIPWLAIYQEYLQNEDMTYKKLAEKYNVPLSTIEYRGGQELWPRRRAEVIMAARKKVQQEAIDAIVAYKKKLIDAGQIASGKALKRLTKDEVEPQQPKDVLSYLVEGLKLEGLGLGFVPADKRVQVDAIVEPGRASVTMTWANGQPLPPYRKPIETPEEEAAWLEEQRKKQEETTTQPQSSTLVNNPSLDNTSQTAPSSSSEAGS